MAVEDQLGFQSPGREVAAKPLRASGGAFGFSPTSSVEVTDPTAQGTVLAQTELQQNPGNPAGSPQRGNFESALRTLAVIKAAKSGNIEGVTGFFNDKRREENAAKERVVIANTVGWKFASSALDASKELPIDERGDFLLSKVQEMRDQYGQEAAESFLNNIGNRAAAKEFQNNDFIDIMMNDPKSPEGQLLRRAMRDPDPLTFERTVNSPEFMGLMTNRYVKREGGRIIKSVQYQVKAIQKAAKDKNHPMHQRAKEIAENGISLMEMFTIQDELMDADGKAMIPENMRIDEADFSAALSSPSIQYHGNLTSSSEGFAEEMYKLDAQKEKEIEAAAASAGIQLRKEIAAKQLNPDAGLITLMNPETGELTRSYRSNDPEIDMLIAQGYQKAPLREISASSAEEAGVKLPKGTPRKIADNIVAQEAQLGRLTEIRRSFNPKFLKTASKLRAQYNRFTGRFSDLDAEDAKWQKEFNALLTQVGQNRDLYIKLITGAQMSEAEASRLRQSIPEMGTGLLEGDPEADFVGKLSSVEYGIRLSLAREKFMLANPEAIVDPSTLDRDGRVISGLTGPAYGVPLDDIPALAGQFYNKTYERLAAENPNADEQSLLDTTDKIFVATFGSSPEMIFPKDGTTLPPVGPWGF